MINLLTYLIALFHFVRKKNKLGVISDIYFAGYFPFQTSIIANNVNEMNKKPPFKLDQKCTGIPVYMSLNNKEMPTDRQIGRQTKFVQEVLNCIMLVKILISEGEKKSKTKKALNTKAKFYSM